MTSQTRDYVFRLRGDADQLSTALDRAAQRTEALAGSTESLARDQAAARAVGDSFIASLTRQAQSAGKTQSELLALRAAELGVADAARPLIQQLQAATAAQQAETAAAAQAAVAQRALANIRAAAQQQERQAFQARQQFIDGLQREAEAIGKTRSELLAQRAAQLGVTAQAQPLIQRLQAGERAFTGFARGGKLSAQELTQVGFQLNDLAVQVASGGNPLIALVQQGSQLSGTFGGIGNAARALVSLVTPAIVVTGGLAAAVGVLTFAYAKGYRDQQAFEDALRLTGGRAGVTKGLVDEYARSIERSTDVTIAAAREAAQAVTASGAFGPVVFEEAARAAALLAERTGRTADEVVKDFAQMREGVARWAADANRSYNFLTAEQFKYIQRLEQQGKREEAARESLRLLADQLGQKTPTELGFLDRALVATAKLWSDFWDAAFDVGRPKTLDEQLREAEAALEVLQQGLGTSPEEGGDAGQRAVDAQRALVLRLRHQRDAERQSVEQQAADAKKNAEEIARLQKDYIDASLTLQRAQQQRSQAAGDLARTRETEANEEAYARELIGYRAYIARRAALERQAVDARLAAVDAELRLERQRTPERPDGPEAVQQQARLVEIETRRYAILQDRARLERQIRANFGEEDRSRAARELAAIAEAEEEEARTLTRRRQAAESAAAELVDTNEQLSLSLVRNVEERGLALIEAERRALVQRLDVYALEGQARQDAQDAVAEYVLLRQRQLTEELKPEWQRMLEAWADTQEAMKRRSDEFQTDFLTGSKETFREFIRDGEINLKRFSDLLVNTLADQVFEQSLAPAVGQLGNFIARTVGLGGGTAQAGGGLAAQTAQTTALSSSTAAITANAAQTVQATGSLGLLSSVAQAAAEALSLVASQAASGAGGGGGGILGSLASAFAGFFTGPSAVTSAVYSPALPVGTPLPSLGGRRAGGPTRSGGYYEVAEEDEPELYRVGRRTYLLNPGQGEVTPARPLRVEGGAAGGQAPSAGNTYVEVINNGGGQVREERSRQGPDEFVRIVIERAVSQIAGDIRGGVGPVSSSLGAIGVGRQAALR